MSHPEPAHNSHAPAHGGHGHDPSEFRAHVRKYWVIFFVLLALTAVTVGISRVHLARPVAIALALVVATSKGSLVALFFMHLIDERKVIYGTLILCAIFFTLLIFLPVLTGGEQSSWAARILHGS